MPSEPHRGDTHEGDWLYVSAPFAHLDGTAAPLVEGIERVIDAAGRVPLSSPETPGATTATSPRARTHEALRFAQACVIDISTDSEEVGADLGCALATGRPIIALKHDAVASGDSLVAAVTAPGRGRVIRYTDAAECIVQLQETFEDPRWWRLVADAGGQDVG